jgi:uncharacterized protein (DUF362 family)/phosphoserine phosphatase
VYWRVEGSLLELTTIRPIAFFTWNSQTYSARLLRRSAVLSMALLRPFLYAANRKAATRIVHAVLRGITRDRLDLLGEEEFEYKLKPLLKEEGVQHLKALQATGADVVLVSQGLDHVMRPLARHLGVRWVIANRLDFRDGVATGRLLSPVIRPRGIFARIREAGPDGQQSPARWVRALGLRGPKALASAIVPAVRVEVPPVRPIVYFDETRRPERLSVRKALGGKRVLLKPNLVEFASSTVINTDAAVVAAAVELFHRLGAAEVRIGEGPGHRRDTLDLADDARYRSTVARFEGIFTDLNRDDVSAVRGFAGESEFYFPNTVLGADLIVSLAKMKTHHWVGVTLSMKNLFGLVPGSVYGWPKNKLHYIGIPESVAELNRKFRNTFAIVDGVVGMEGNGPIQGTPKPVGVLVMGRDLVAVDATCCRIMGVDPEKVEYLRLTADIGHVRAERIEQRGESIASVRNDFTLIDDFKGLRLA